MRRFLLSVTLWLVLPIAALAEGGQPVSCVIDSIPQGYHLYMYDDCGVEGRQPHIRMEDTYAWTFNLSDTDADLKQRSAVFSYKQVNAVYDDLDPKLDYILALTYASDHVYNRIQSLEADGVQLHAPYPLPKAKAVRVICKVPRSVTEDGRMALAIKIHGEVNATVSIIELWANAPSPITMRFGSIAGGQSGFTGRVLDFAYDPMPGVEVRLSRVGKPELIARTTTDAQGVFSFERKAVEESGLGDLQITATNQGQEISQMVSSENLFFDPVRYRPIPEKVGGLKNNQKLLDGLWRINPAPAEDSGKQPLTALGWGDFKVPGQWLQQGYDVPQDKPVAVATEFTIPKEWAGYRIFLRFDAIHAGTTYRLNGKELGYSENLFTPVEWDITDAAHPGEKNRLDLDMLVATKSEALSYSSGYAFHSLGGIDRSVRIYALPTVHIKDMRVSTDLDKDYRDADLSLKLTLDNPLKEAVELHMTLLDSEGKEVGRIGQIGQIGLTAQVSNPLKWTAEKPNLYRLIVELKKGDQVLERIERNIGFRKIEIRDRQLYVNGARVKLAGACHHEVDPLTGRADTMRLAEEDVRLMKAANLNYIRTSHYPPTKELLDAADRIGMYVEVEAPFCWVGATDDMSFLQKILTPTSAMVDYCHVHPSVTIWSIANESHYNEVFEISDKMVRELDPTRPTTFNNPDPKQISSIANMHYPNMPFDALLPDDPRPLILGETFFPVCHEQTDVSINPGLRELWGLGSSDPDSEWAKECAADHFKAPLKAGVHPGAWSHIYHSNRMIGAAIWASHDDAFYFAGGKYCGYAWHHGFWGLIDVWRRPKPEWWLSKLIFSPVWFPVRQVDFTPGQRSIRIPVENRYSFTDLGELKFTWELGKSKGRLKASLPPASTGEIEMPVPEGAQAGDKIILKVTDASGGLVNALAIHLGKAKLNPLPKPSAGPPAWHDDGKTITIEGGGFSLALDKASGDLDPASPKHNCAVTRFPAVHLTRYDFGDLAGPNSPPYAEFPDAKTHVIEGVSVENRAEGVEITIRDRYDGFAGSVTWLLDSKGVGQISYDYVYSGGDMNVREIGAKLLLKPACDEVKWRRWSEWDVYPDDFIGRTEGTAKARRDPKLGEERWDKKPTWPWSLDQTELGTADFRSIKFNIYDASLVAPDGSGMAVHANADAHFRPALSKDGVRAHVLSKCPLGQILLKKGDRLTGEYAIQLLPKKLR
jgi:beta-galactosidase